MTIDEVKSTVLKKVRKNSSIAVLRRVERIIDLQDKSPVLAIPLRLREKLKASQQDIENGKLIENKLLRKEVRIWLKNR